MTRTCFQLILICVTLVPLFNSTAHGAVPAFPGAEGFGSQTKGGRGGRVIEVTNLNDAGPGSLRAVCDLKGPRIVVFRTGGTIYLKKRIELRHANITVAGQTAPGKQSLWFRNIKGDFFATKRHVPD